MLKTITDRGLGLLRRFGREEQGIMAVEFVLTLPVFLFAIFGIYTYWDGYHAMNTAQKATYTVADLVSRQKRELNDQFFQGMHNLMEYLTGDNLPVEMRITSVTYSGVRNQFEVEWSRSPYNEIPELTTESLQPLAQHIPMMADGDSVILVEANLQFKPAFAETPAFYMYLGEQEFKQFIVTRPRFVPHLCLQNVYCG